MSLRVSTLHLPSESASSACRETCGRGSGRAGSRFFAVPRMEDIRYDFCHLFTRADVSVGFGGDKKGTHLTLTKIAIHFQTHRGLSWMFCFLTACQQMKQSCSKRLSYSHFLFLLYLMTPPLRGSRWTRWQEVTNYHKLAFRPYYTHVCGPQQSLADAGSLRSVLISFIYQLVFFLYWIYTCIYIPVC